MKRNIDSNEVHNSRPENHHWRTAADHKHSSAGTDDTATSATGPDGFGTGLTSVNGPVTDRDGRRPRESVPGDDRIEGPTHNLGHSRTSSDGVVTLASSVGPDVCWEEWCFSQSEVLVPLSFLFGLYDLLCCSCIFLISVWSVTVNQLVRYLKRSLCNELL